MFLTKIQTSYSKLHYCHTYLGFLLSNSSSKCTSQDPKHQLAINIVLVDEQIFLDSCLILAIYENTLSKSSKLLNFCFQDMVIFFLNPKRTLCFIARLQKFTTKKKNGTYQRHVTKIITSVLNAPNKNIVPLQSFCT